MSERELTITKLERAPEGYWRARVSSGGMTVQVDRRHGSWQAGGGDHTRRDVLPAVARRLQDRVRPIEAAERRAVSAAAEREAKRRLREFKRDCSPCPRDLAQRAAEVGPEVEAELRGVSLERIYSDPELAWARPA